MPVDFDDEDIADVIEEVEGPQDPGLPTTEDVDVQMSEVEARLEMAQYYRLILNDSMFSDAPNPDVAARVESEIRDFVRGRMAILVGVGEAPKKAEKVFSDSEVESLRTLALPEIRDALKALAAKVLKKPAILEAKPRPVETPAQPKVIREPTLKKVGTPAPKATPAPKPAPVAAGTRPVRGRKQEKQYKTVTDPATGKEVKMDITPQARPVGVQPLPTPRSKEQIEAANALSAHTQAAVAVQTLEKKLTGR